MSERSFYLGEGAGAFFATLHAPDGEAASTAVVVLPPFGWEETASHRALRDWALHLTSRRHHVLRLDLPGTGDSPGDLEPGARWESWVAATHAAAARLRAETGVVRLAAIGVGSGGYLAFEAAVSGTVDDVVVWATPPSGRHFLRELSAFGRLEASRIEEAGGPPAPEQQDGVEAGGFVLPTSLGADIGVIDLEHSVLPPGARVLLLDRDGAGSSSSLAGALRARGTGVDLAHGEGYASMMAPPDQSRPPRAVFARVDDWLMEAPESAHGTDGCAAPIESEAIRCDDGVVERPVVVERRNLFLRGVLAEPDLATSPVTIVFLNAGAVRRIGPHRLWVTTARRWAGRGVPSLRIDLEGIGDADGDGEVYRDVARFHDRHLVDHVSGVLDALVDLGLPSRFVLVGLCSGGFWAFQSALGDDRVAAAVMVNTRILFWHEHIDAFRDLRRTRLLARPTTWKRLLRGDVPASRWRAFAAWVASSAAGRVRLGSRDGRSLFEWQAVNAREGFSTLERLGRRARFVFCEGEPLRDELTEAGLLSGPGRPASVSATFVPGRDHTLNPVWMHRYVDEAIDGTIRSEIELAAPVS